MRLTKQEKKVLIRCAEFILAGEWPWQEQTADEAEEEGKCLEHAVEKLHRE